MCELGYTNEALHPGAQKHISYLGADGSLVLAVDDWISAGMMSHALVRVGQRCQLSLLVYSTGRAVSS